MQLILAEPLDPSLGLIQYHVLWNLSVVGIPGTIKDVVISEVSPLFKFSVFVSLEQKVMF